jgi:thymidylate kinase
MATIIIEGPNATGKTTLAIELALELSKRGYKYRCNQLPRARTELDQFKLYDLCESILAAKVPIIFDRVPFISDLAYPVDFRVECQIFNRAKELVSKYKPILIYCKIPEEIAKANYFKRGTVKENYNPTVYSIYEKFMRHFPKKIEYNYLKDHDIIDTIEAHIAADRMLGR